MMKRPQHLVLWLVLSVALVFGGCAPANVKSTSSTKPGISLKQDYKLFYGEVADIDRAKQCAIDFAKLSGAEVTFASSDTITNADKETKYELKFTSGASRYVFHIRAADGFVLRYDFDGELTDAGKELGQAYAGALLKSMVPGANIDDTGMDTDHKNDDGLPVYEGLIGVDGDRYKFEIHTITGLLLQWTKE